MEALNLKNNIAYQAVDIHCLNEMTKNKIALQCLRKDGKHESYTYNDLKHFSNQFSNALISLGVQQNEKIFCLTPRIPELYIAAMGIFKTLNIFCPIFSVFGPGPIKERMLQAEASVLISTASLYQKKIQPIEKDIPSLKKIILINDLKNPANIPHVYWWDELMQNAKSDYLIPATNKEQQAIIHFTSGTTGKPKGAIHVHAAAAHHALSGKIALDIQNDDIFWCTADPGWVTGTSYGIISPLVNGATNIIVEAEFDAHQWMQILQEYHVNVWYTAPTAIRMLMNSDLKESLPLHLKHLRFIASVGEPLNPDAVLWGEKAFGIPIHDNWWQTETGGIMIANTKQMKIKPGSMGKPLPGIEAKIVHVSHAGKLMIESKKNMTGMIAIKKGWPSMFRGYLHQDEKYMHSFVDNYYLSGDLAKMDQDGYFWFVGRSDDVIKTAGHLVGPFEIENILLEHPTVMEAAVIGKPDQFVGTIIKAYIVLKKNSDPDEKIKKSILAFAREKLGSSISPKEIQFVEDLPKTRSGKIMRRLLKARELGLPEGDTSVLI